MSSSVTYAVTGAAASVAKSASARAGGTSPLRMPCHLISWSSGQPCAASVSCQRRRSSGQSRVAHGDAAEREEPALVDLAALVEEEQVHSEAQLGA